MDKYTEDTKTVRVVVHEDLNPHNTLFAAQLSKWFVEANYLCGAVNMGDTSKVVCLKLIDFILKKPGHLGDILEFESSIVHAGRTSFITYTKVKNKLTDETIGEGGVKFVSIDENYKSAPHHLKTAPTDDEEVLAIRKKYSNY